MSFMDLSFQAYDATFWGAYDLAIAIDSCDRKNPGECFHMPWGFRIFFWGDGWLVNSAGGGGGCCQLPVALHKKRHRHSGIEKMSGFLIGSCFFFEMLRGMVREIVVASSSWMIRNDYMGVSKNHGTPKSSILIGFSIINHPFWGTPIFGNTYIYCTCEYPRSVVNFEQS